MELNYIIDTLVNFLGFIITACSVAVGFAVLCFIAVSVFGTVMQIRHILEREGKRDV